VPGELGGRPGAEAFVRSTDALVHAAVQWQGPRTRGAASHGPADVFQGINLTGSLPLFQAAFEAGVGRCVFISSCAVHDVILQDRPLDETHSLWPKSHYGAHKAALEAFVHSYGLGEGWPICALRPTGIYGLAHPPQASRWYSLVGQVIRGEPIASPRGGKEVHAADVARAVELLLSANAQSIAGQAYNCYDRYIADQDVARITKEITGSKSDIADLNRGPKNQIETGKIRSLGMTFGGDALLRRTMQELIDASK
jgi:nucleoside-diphosphate-sugar epimerase